MNKLIYGAATAVALFFAADAHATLQIATGNQGGNLGTENVLFNEPGLLDNGPKVQGITNQTDKIVDFTGNGTEILTTPSGGQARIEAVDGAFDEVTITLNDPKFGFSALIFNIDAAADGFVDIIVTDQFGATFSLLNEPLDGTGENFFRVFSNDNQVAVSAFIDSSVSLTAISDLAQVRIGPAALNQVPEPATLLVIGGGLLGLGLLRIPRS